jgi:hypothetical protein
MASSALILIGCTGARNCDSHPREIAAEIAKGQCSQKPDQRRRRDEYRRADYGEPRVRAVSATSHRDANATGPSARMRVARDFLLRRANQRQAPLPITTIVITSSAAQMILSVIPP